MLSNRLYGLSIFNQSSNGLVNGFGSASAVFLESIVGVPGVVRLGDAEQLHEVDTSLDQSTSQQAVPSQGPVTGSSAPRSCFVTLLSMDLTELFNEVQELALMLTRYEFR